MAIEIWKTMNQWISPGPPVAAVHNVELLEVVGGPCLGALYDRGTADGDFTNKENGEDPFENGDLTWFNRQIM